MSSLKNSDMEFLALGDLKGKTHDEIINHLCNNYAGKNSGFDYGEINDDDVLEAKEKLKNMKVVVAYESVGDYGCDSSSFFILKNDKEEYFELQGGHCSCYGFEGQLKDLESTHLKALQVRASNDNLFWTGGYDYSSDENKKKANDFVIGLIA